VFGEEGLILTFGEKESLILRYPWRETKLKTNKNLLIFQLYLQVVILDAETFSETARIRFFAEGTVTEGFHGIFVPSGLEGKPKRF